MRIERHVATLMMDRESLAVLKKYGREDEDVQKVIRYLNELKSQVFTKMTTTVEDEAANRALLHDLTEAKRTSHGGNARRARTSARSAASSENTCRSPWTRPHTRRR